MLHPRVLLADPDRALLDTHEDVLTQHGYQVETAVDGLDCLAKLRAFRPDLLVLEPDLLWGDGAGILTLMYQEPDVPYVPVVVVSWRPDPDGLRLVGSYPVSDYLLKPLPPARLAERVTAILTRRRTARKVHRGRRAEMSASH